MKNIVLISSAALVIIGILVFARNKKDRNTITVAVNDLLQTNSALRLLHHAKKAAIKDLHSHN